MEAKETVTRVLMRLSRESHLAAEAVDELENKCPSYNGGFVRAASVLLLRVVQNLNRGKRDREDCQPNS